MSTQMIKSQMRDAILVTMAQYLDKAVLQILSNAIEEQLVRVNVEEITTLPAEVNNSIDEQNKYVIQLFLIKKEELKEETKYNYLNAIKKLLTQIDKPLVEMISSSISDGTSGEMWAIPARSISLVRSIMSGGIYQHFLIGCGLRN